jgi:hypothetical protein
MKEIRKASRFRAVAIAGTLVAAWLGQACGGQANAPTSSPDASSGSEAGPTPTPDAMVEAGPAPTGDATVDSGPTPMSDAMVEASPSPTADATSDSGAPDGQSEIPMNHRPDDSQCASARSAGTCTIGSMLPTFDCSSDTQCTDGGANGRCTNGAGGIASCLCTYDTCTVDTDCPSGQLCVCHGSDRAYGGNTCMPGNCRVDSDCGQGGYCSPSPGGACGYYVSGYYCHTSNDACVNDSDCSDSGLGKSCVWSKDDARWECQLVPICL